MGANGTKQKAPVSAWRELLVANELNELQLFRRCACLPCFWSAVFPGCIHSFDRRSFLFANKQCTKNCSCAGVETRSSFPACSLLVSVLAVHGLGVSSAITNANDDAEVFLRYGFIVGFYLAASIVQVAFKEAVHFRLTSHPVHDFIDMLPLANVSLFLFSERLAGHYIHGRGASSTSDQDLRGLAAQLRQEAEMEVSARGLLSDSEDETVAENQVFEVFINGRTRRQYERSLLDHLDENALSITGGASNAQAGSAAPEVRIFSVAG